MYIRSNLEGKYSNLVKDKHYLKVLMDIYRTLERLFAL